MISYIKYKIKVIKIRQTWREDAYLRRLLKRQSRPYPNFQNCYRVIRIIADLELNRD